MFIAFVIIPLIVAIISTGLWLFSLKKAKSNETYLSSWGFSAIITACIAFVITLSCLWVSLAVANYQYNYYYDLVSLDEDYDIAVDRRNEQIAEVRNELDGYADFERDIIQGVDSEIILSFPQIRNSEVLTNKVETILSFNERLYEIRNSAVRIQKELFANEDNPFVLRPPFAWPEWNDYFEGTSNPIFDGTNPVLGEDLIREGESDN